MLKCRSEMMQLTCTHSERGESKCCNMLQLLHPDCGDGENGRSLYCSFNFPVYLQNIIKIALNAKKISAAALSLPVPGGTNLRASRAQTERVLDGNSNG